VICDHDNIEHGGRGWFICQVLISDLRVWGADLLTCVLEKVGEHQVMKHVYTQDDPWVLFRKGN